MKSVRPYVMLGHTNSLLKNLSTLQQRCISRRIEECVVPRLDFVQRSSVSLAQQ